MGPQFSRSTYIVSTFPQKPTVRDFSCCYFEIEHVAATHTNRTSTNCQNNWDALCKCSIWTKKQKTYDAMAKKDVTETIIHI